MVVETITIRTVAKKSNLSVKAITRAVEELKVDVFSMRMKAYGHRGYVNQIKLEDAEKVIAKAVEYKEEPKKPRVSKMEQLKSNDIEIVSETKTQYRLCKDGITLSVGKYKSLEKILEKFEAKKEKEPKEPTPVSTKRYEEFVPEVKKEIEREFPNTEVKNVVIIDKVDDTHYWVKWDGVEHNPSLGDMQVGFPLMGVTLNKKEEEMKVEEKQEIKKEEEVPMSFDSIYGGDVDPVTGIEGVEVEDDFGEKLDGGCGSSFDINSLYAMYAKKDAETAREKERACEIKD